MRSVLLAAFALALGAAGAQAQKSPLDRVDSLIAAGESTRAAALLKQWQQSNSADNNPRALYLAAQLEPNAELARDLYVGIALSHPTSSYAAPALLRLGQLAHAARDWQRAISYLDRLIADYPAAKERESAYLWLLRSNFAAGRSRDACALAGVALRGEVRDQAISEQIRGEEQRACGAAASNVANAPAVREPSKPPARPEPQPPAPPSDPKPNSGAAPKPAPESKAQTAQPKSESAAQSTSREAKPADRNDAARTNARFAVQSGAFKDARGANGVANGLKKAGFDARVTQLEGTTLNHVRVGYFATRAEAVAMMQKLKAAGFNAMIVDDVTREK